MNGVSARSALLNHPRHSGARQRREPESITSGWEYGFRARPTQVGLGQLGRLAPISGKPEIGGPSRNDSGEIGAISSGSSLGRELINAQP